MVNRIKILIFLGMMLGVYGHVIAQRSVNAGGGDAIGAGGTASFSIGQIFYTTIGNNGTTVAQGVQQASQLQAIPTMSEWGFMILMLLFVIIGVQSLKSSKSARELNLSDVTFLKKG